MNNDIKVILEREDDPNAEKRLYAALSMFIAEKDLYEPNEEVEER